MVYLYFFIVRDCIDKSNTYSAWIIRLRVLRAIEKQPLMKFSMTVIGVLLIRLLLDIILVS